MAVITNEVIIDRVVPEHSIMLMYASLITSMHTCQND